MADLSINYKNISSLTAWKTNARTHSKKQIQQIANSIEEFGFTNPVLIDGENQILAGHGRVAAAVLLGLTEVPCVPIESMTPAQKRAYVIADNKLALNAGWDEDLLAEELGELFSAENLEFDPLITGFSVAEIDLIIDKPTLDTDLDPADDLLPDQNIEPRCKLGDIWQLGEHRLVCGNSLETDHVTALMDGRLARLIFSDPPYNVKIDGNVCGTGKIKHREFAMASGEMDKVAFTEFLKSSFFSLRDSSLDGSIHFICMDWRHMDEIMTAGNEVYSELKNLIVWAKDNGGMGTFYRSRHELIFAFKNGTQPHRNNFELGQHGRYRTNVWQYKGVNSRGKDRMNELAMHPTVKPVAMIADAIRDCSARREIILDLFGGSGSTLIAAHKTARRARLMELDPHYCDVIIHRWETYAKDDAVHLGSFALNEEAA